MSLAETTPFAVVGRLDRWMSWMRAKQAKCTQYVAPSAVRLGQRWKVCSTQGVWLDATVQEFDEGLVILRFDQPERAGSREGVTLPHFMLTTPECYRLSDR